MINIGIEITLRQFDVLPQIFLVHVSLNAVLKTYRPNAMYKKIFHGCDIVQLTIHLGNYASKVVKFIDYC